MQSSCRSALRDRHVDARDLRVVAAFERPAGFRDEALIEELTDMVQRYLVRDEVPVIPLWFEVGFNLYRTNILSGIHPNPVDTHPIHAIRRFR